MLAGIEVSVSMALSPLSPLRGYNQSRISVRTDVRTLTNIFKFIPLAIGMVQLSI